jgi:hypothetical protein
MGDLFFDDIEDRTYTDQMILADLEALVKSGQREGSVLDYKSDLSELDNWPQTVAAFANSFGGLIVFGVEGKNDQPRRVTGFDPKGVEIKTKLTSMVIDRIQPRPDFFVRVVTYDKNTNREIALLRVSEGSNPPYMHSKGQEHRIYVRIGAQKAEADYLQLMGLLEKQRQNVPQFESSPDGAFGTDPNFFVPDPEDSSKRASSEFFKLVLIPPGDVSPIRLTRETELRFAQCISDIRGPVGTIPSLRSQDATVFRVSENAYREQRFALSRFGSTGFISYPAIRTQNGLRFVPEDFCRSLLDFLSISVLFFERAVRFYGPLSLHSIVSITVGADLFDGPLGLANRTGGAYLFEPPLQRIFRFSQTQLEVSAHPILPGRMQEYLEVVLTALARPHGSVLSGAFGESIKPEIDQATARLVRARQS